MRPLLAFVVPHLVQAEWAGGAWRRRTRGRPGGLQLARHRRDRRDRLRRERGAARATSMADESQWLARAPELARTALPHVIEGTRGRAPRPAMTSWSTTGSACSTCPRRSCSPVAAPMARDALRERGHVAGRAGLPPPGAGQPDPSARAASLDPGIANELALLRQSGRSRSGAARSTCGCRKAPATPSTATSASPRSELLTPGPHQPDPDRLDVLGRGRRATTRPG